MKLTDTKPDEHGLIRRIGGAALILACIVYHIAALLM